MNVWVDRLGGAASTACAVHCVVMSVAPAVVSVLGLGLLASEAFEWGLFGMAVAFAAAAAWWGYRTHRSAWVLLGFATGILALAAGRMGEALSLFEGGAWLAVLGGGILVATHVASATRTRAHRETCAHG